MLPWKCCAIKKSKFNEILEASILSFGLYTRGQDDHIDNEVQKLCVINSLVLSHFKDNLIACT